MNNYLPKTLTIVLTLILTFVLSLPFGNDSAAADKKSNLLKPAKRVITLAPHAFELVYSLGAGDRIVATAEYSNYPENAQHVPSIGGYNGLQIEKILSLEPDLVIAWESGNREEEIKRLESLGLNVYRSHPRSLEDIYTDLMNIGHQLGLEQKARMLAEKFKTEIQLIEAENASKQHLRVFYQMWHQPLRTVNEISWLGQFVKRCGGDNIFANTASEYPVIEPEAVIAKDPQVILMTGDMTDNKNIWKDWKNISAVKNNQFYYLPADPLHRATLRAVDGLKSVCKALDEARAVYRSKPGKK